MRQPPEFLSRATHIFVSHTEERTCGGTAHLPQIERLLGSLAAPGVTATLEYKLAGIAPLASVVSEVRSHLGEPPLRNGVIEESPPVEDSIVGNRVLTVASIARPARFEQAILDAGAESVHVMRYADHYRLRTRDVQRVYRSARACDAQMVVTTMKDAMRIALKQDPLAKLSPGEADWLVPRCFVALFELETDPADAFEKMTRAVTEAAISY